MYKSKIRWGNSQLLVNCDHSHAFCKNVMVCLCILFLLATTSTSYADFFCGSSINKTQVTDGDQIEVTVTWAGNPANHPNVAYAQFIANGNILIDKAVTIGNVATCTSVSFEITVPSGFFCSAVLKAGLASPSSPGTWGEWYAFENHSLTFLPSTDPPFAPIPPRIDDHTFVTTLGDCILVEHDSSFDVEIDRYVGETDPNSNLVYASEMVVEEFIGEFAMLQIAAFDIDCQTIFCDEYKVIYFNGEKVSSLVLGNKSHLRGPASTWSVSCFKIPIEKIRFPSSIGTNGSSPTKVTNSIKIVNSNGLSTQVGWAALKLNVMSPIVLIHGNSSDGGFWDRQHFTDELKTRHLVYDNSISFPNGGVNRRSRNGYELNSHLPRIAKSYGVDSVHLVAHSKGGLDAREYLAKWYSKYLPAAGTPEVLSLTTLSTPHGGAVGADLAERKREAVRKGIDIDFSLIPGMVDRLANIEVFLGDNSGQRDLTTYAVGMFNASNIPTLPDSVMYNRVGSNADLDGNDAINLFDEIGDFTGDDIWTSGLALEFSPLLIALKIDIDFPIAGTYNAGLRAINTLYAAAGNFGSISVIPKPTGGYIAVDTSLPTIFRPNDTVVTAASAFGQIGKPSYANMAVASGGKAPAFFSSPGIGGRNHATIANAGVAQTIIPWLLSREKIHGDLEESGCVMSTTN